MFWGVPRLWKKQSGVEGHIGYGDGVVSVVLLMVVLVVSVGFYVGLRGEGVRRASS